MSNNYEIGDILLFYPRGVQLPVGGPGVQAAVLLLPDHDLRAGLHARHRLLGQLLARPQGGAGPRGAGRHHAAHHVHAGEAPHSEQLNCTHVNPDGLHQLRAAARGLHQGYRRVAGRLCRLRVLRPHGVRAGQLRPQVDIG